MNRAQTVTAVLAAFVLLGLFSPEIYDTDFWWYLCTGQYIADTHSLPVPDPFAWTTAGARETYTGEAQTRRFNLTHELAGDRSWCSGSGASPVSLATFLSLAITLAVMEAGRIRMRTRRGSG